MNKLKVKDEKALVRDVESNAILNTDVFELQQHRARRMRSEAKDTEIANLKNDVNNLTNLVNKLLNTYNK
jgi:hypothetical protein